jgi:guanine deaminase
VNQIVHAEDATGVRHVMIGGDFVLFDRKHTRIDIAKLASEAEAARARLEEGSRSMHALYEKLSPVVASFCPGLAAQPYHLNRYMCDAPAAGL